MQKRGSRASDFEEEATHLEQYLLVFQVLWCLTNLLILRKNQKQQPQTPLFMSNGSLCIHFLNFWGREDILSIYVLPDLLLFLLLPPPAFSLGASPLAQSPGDSQWRLDGSVLSSISKVPSWLRTPGVLTAKNKSTKASYFPASN